jgi:large subunit ribosomal protein L13
VIYKLASKTRFIYMKTYSAKPSDVNKNWWIIDAEDVVLGRLASITALMLRGKHKPMYSTHIDCGDHIVVINADKVKLTGNKLADKFYYRHTGHPGGIKETTAGKILAGRFPERVIQKAVERMLPRGPMGREQLGKLRVYSGAEHPHTAQAPKPLDLAAMNEKNKR